MREGTHSVAGVVLAAGASRRAGACNKLVADVDGTPMVRRVVDTALAAGLTPVIVVTSARDEQVRGTLGGLDIVETVNPTPEEGMSSSIRCGIEALPDDVSGAAFLLGDMPWVTAGTVRALGRAFAAGEGQGIPVPVHGGRRGNPVVWPKRFFPEISALRGDEGARSLLAIHAAEVHEMPVDDPGVLRDVDTEEEVAVLADPPHRPRG